MPDKELSPQEYDLLKQKLEIEKNLMLEKSLDSRDPNEILKAQMYLQAQKTKVEQGQTRGYLFDPLNAQFTGQGYKRDTKKVSFDVLKRMGTLHVAKMVKKTRIDQVKNFLTFSVDMQKEGFTIRRRKSLFDENVDLDEKDKKEVEHIVKFLENSKLPVETKKSAIAFDPTKWDIFDDLDEFVSMILDDSLTYDQMTFELQRNRRFDLVSYKAVDASTIRVLDTIDPRFWKDGEMQYDLVQGYLPRYAQVWGSEIQKNPATNEQIVYYPWELAFAVRNKNTDIYRNGYGESELETLVSIVTWLLYGMEYNGNFFKNGSNPRGFLNIKSGMGGQDNINDFRETWRHMMTGSQNSHKIPVFEGIDMEWTDLQTNNKDMEFNVWIEFLMIMFCAVYTIDPSEMGWNFKQASQVFGQDGQKERLSHSREKGLKPLLAFLQKVFTKYIVSEINPDFEFVFTGVDLEDDEAKIKNINAALAAGITSFEKQFLAYEGEKYDEKKHTILNSVFQQAKTSEMQMKMYGGGQSNEAVDQENPDGEGEGAKNPFDEYSKSFSNEKNPIIDEMQNYISKAFGYKIEENI